jgi:hypothetical protein
MLFGRSRVIENSLMVDPSTLLSAEGPQWVRENLERGVTVVVSSRVERWLARDLGFDLEHLVAPEDWDELGPRLDELAELAPALELFDHRDAELAPGAQEVLQELVWTDVPSALVWADEWAYLQSHSWLVSKLRRPIEAFRDAGSAVVELGEKAAMHLISEVIPPERVPASITPEIAGRAALKWVAVGGATIGGGTLGGLLGGPLAPVAAKAGGFLGGTMAKAAVVALDP